ncbi:IS3 family transposase, partial [Salmonella enterica subsp. enterica serovar Cerro]|nr:IS3 family transposase [Salmonella enterica subsp. enterica serovar Cerro]EHE7506613.1 IS3 family transposase [Salmonella enterica subsp. enterica serovar Cerro]EHL8872334.1 IS3 family transposase [Salmonella enterica subsp. enterica serovar Cerro]EIT0602155.1 IS3 family transposase [Salmonella enterica subsp. enterica serovar Cerro]
PSYTKSVSWQHHRECDYNRWRRHSACGGLSPEQFENQNLA